MTAADTLRARFRREWRKRPELADVNRLLETTLSFLDAPKAKKEAIGKTGRLSSSELAQALQRELGKEVVPALHRIRRAVDEGTMAIERERNASAKHQPTWRQTKGDEDREEALALVRAATEIGIRQIRFRVGMSPYDFEHWFATASGV